MRKDNPAVYECPKSNMHTWKREGEGARCIHCKLVLSAADAAEVFDDRNTLSVPVKR